MQLRSQLFSGLRLFLVFASMSSEVYKARSWEMARVGDENKRKFTLRVYRNYDLTGGGPPFGHARAFHVELAKGKDTLARNASAGEKLERLVAQRGKPAGEKRPLPYLPDYREGSYEQDYVLPSGLSLKKIEKEIPYERVLW